MPKFMGETMKRILPVLLSLCALISVIEGGAVLCKTSIKSKPQNSRSEHSSAAIPRSAQSLRSDDDYLDDNSLRKESLRDKILRAMLMEDSEENNRAESERSDFSVLDASVRADMARDEARKNQGDWNRRHTGSNRHVRYDQNRYGKYDANN